MCLIIKQLAKLSFNHSIGRTHSWRLGKIIYSYLRYISSPRMHKINNHTQPDSTNPLTHTINYSVFFLAFSTRVAVAIIFFAFSPLRCPLQRRNRKRYGWISAVSMRATERYCSELSISYSACLKSAGYYVRYQAKSTRGLLRCS